MPRENSFSDEDGRSLTPDIDDDLPPPLHSPVQPTPRWHEQSPTLQTSLQPSAFRKKSSSSVAKFPIDTNPLPPTPKERFRYSARRVMQLNRMSSMMARRGVGAEPGVDARRDSAAITYGHLKQKCRVEITDYSSVSRRFRCMTNLEFVRYLSDATACGWEPWVRVRWINVGGMSWDVIQALAIKYDLHPLALEDVLHQKNHLRSKADYYQRHLFLRVLSHTLVKSGKDNKSAHEDRFLSSESPESVNETVDPDEGCIHDSGLQSRLGVHGESRWRKTAVHVRDIETLDTGTSVFLEKSGSFAPSRKKKRDATTMRLIQELDGSERVDVALNPVYVFLLRDGTVISMHPHNDLEFTAPIRERLQFRHTGLRNTADPSLLVHSLLDLVVDAALEVVDEYQKRIVKLEHEILRGCSMNTVKFLHIISGDLILHKRTLAPIKTLVYGLRRYDLDRAVALYDTSKLPEGWKQQGYMSHKAKIYLADVFDHMEYVLASMDMFAGISENLINYTFNTASYQMNNVMRKLTMVSIICLPLTLLTGYFGMNFVEMWSVHSHSDVLFWQIALPLLAVLIPLLAWVDLVKVYHFMQRKLRDTA